MSSPERKNSSQPSAAYPMSQPKRRYTEDDEPAGEAILSEVDDAFGITEKAAGCIWALVKLPFRLIWKLIDAITDVF